MKYFETERLIFRDWKKEDEHKFVEMNNDSDVMKFFPKKLNESESLELLTKIKSNFEKNGFGLYAVESKEKNEFVGFLGFNIAEFESDFTPCIEIGWRFRKEFWGEGLATEGASKCLKYGLEELDFKQIYSFTADINIPSKRVMEKIGLNFYKTFNYPNVKEGHILEKHVLFGT
ncbi:MAG: GNAT family N-acetyltransferase [Finegoldia magna]|nr:GNAT family N-acetyltransferase [Finegoldia magna]